MIESKIQSNVIKRYELEGWLVVKLIKTTKNGIPDLMCLKNGKVLFIEVKSSKGIVSELQKYRHKELQKQGFDVIILNK